MSEASRIIALFYDNHKVCYDCFMKTSTNKKQKKAWLWWLGGGVVGIVLIAIATIFYFQWQAEAPKPLGDQLEYIGKVDYGCIGFCDSLPGSTYYYTTEMELEGVIKYFNKARLYQPSAQEGTSIRVWLINEQQNKSFILNYDTNIASVKKHFNIPINKHVVTLPKYSYDLARDSL